MYIDCEDIDFKMLFLMVNDHIPAGAKLYYIRGTLGVFSVF